MAKRLSKRDTQAIIDLIRGWQEYKLTWPSICEAAEPMIGKVPTRQSLNAHTPIVQAYKAKKEALKEKGPQRPRPSSLQTAASRIANLEAQLEEIKEKNRKYKEMFTIWQYNAYKFGVGEDMLNQPLPEVDRERSDGQKR